MVEYHLGKMVVMGSSPIVGSIVIRCLSGRVLDGFEDWPYKPAQQVQLLPVRLDDGLVAQGTERWFPKPKVAGSNPAWVIRMPP